MVAEALMIPTAVTSIERVSFIQYENLFRRNLSLLSFLIILSYDWQCWKVIDWNFAIDMWQWMKCGTITLLRNQNDRHLSKQLRMNSVQSAWKHSNQLERLRPQYLEKEITYNSKVSFLATVSYSSEKGQRKHFLLI